METYSKPNLGITPPVTNILQLWEYLQARWPKLADRFEVMTVQKMERELDTITCLVTDETLPREKAYARWHWMLERMYAINGDLEF